MLARLGEPGEPEQRLRALEPQARPQARGLDAALEGQQLPQVRERALRVALGQPAGHSAALEGDAPTIRQRPRPGKGEQALALYRRLGDEANSAHVRNNLGLIHKTLCEWEAAETHLLAALELHRQSGRFAETAGPLLNLGIVRQKRGDWGQALEYYVRAEQVFVQVADDLRIPLVRIGCANIARLQRRFDEAESLLGDALERARAHGAQREQVLALEFMGELDFDLGRPEEALEHYDGALALARRVAPDGDLIVEIERRRAEALCAIGRLDEAARACATALRLAGETNDRLAPWRAAIAPRRSSRGPAP